MDEERDEAERLRRQIDRLKTELERERVNIFKEDICDHQQWYF